MQIAMPNVQLQIRHRLHNHARIDFSKTLVESRNLRVDRERDPRHRREANIVKKVRIWRAIVRVVEVHVKKSIDFEPGERLIVAPRLEAIADAETPNRPFID